MVQVGQAGRGQVVPGQHSGEGQPGPCQADREVTPAQSEGGQRRAWSHPGHNMSRELDRLGHKGPGLQRRYHRLQAGQFRPAPVTAGQVLLQQRGPFWAQFSIPPIGSC